MSSEPALRKATTGDARAIAQVRVDAWRATYRGMIPDAYLDGMTVEGSEAIWRRVLDAPSDRTSVFVAEQDGAVVGFSAGTLLDAPKFDLTAELAAVYVMPPAQRAGLGRRLVGAVAAAERAHGANGLLTWVIAGNRPARAFYESLGGELLIEQPFQWDGMDLVEAGYGFRDLDRLVALCGGLPAMH